MQPQIQQKKNGLTVFLTGSTGFLGSALLRLLVTDGHRVICLRRPQSNLFRIKDLAERVEWQSTDSFDENAVFAREKVDLILHCATDYGRKSVDPIRTIEANLILPLRLLHAGASARVRYFINTDTILDKGIDNYSRSKKQFVEWLESYKNRITGFNISLEHFYGSGDDRSKFLSSVIHALLSKTDKINLTPGEQKRDFIHIDDVARAFMAVIDNSERLGQGFHRFEVGSGHSTSIRAAVELARNLSGNTETELCFGALPYRQNEVMETVIDTASLRSLGWAPKITLEEGLKRTLEEEKKGYACAP